MRSGKRGLRYVLVLATLSFCGIALGASNDEAVKESLASNLNFMRGVYRSMYAPTAWKKKFAGWDLDEQINLALDKTRNAPRMSVTDARGILKDFIYSMKDYHVSIGFIATEKATLPFVVRGVKDKFFLAYIDRTKLPQDSFPFNVGDQLVMFDGKPAAQAVAEVQAEMPPNVAETDRALAEIMLTKRRASRGYRVPQGPVMVSILPKGSDQVSNLQMIWEYTPEEIQDPSIVTSASARGLRGFDSPFKRSSLLSPKMIGNVDMDLANLDNPHDIGGRRTFTPSLGVKIWESEALNPFHAYIFKGQDRRLIGYVRIPSYMPTDTNDAIAEFAKIVAMFEVATDGIVIDQVNNPGGSVFYLYSLVSMLNNQAVHTPRHQMSLSQKEIVEAYAMAGELEKIKNDDDAKKTIGKELDGYPASYQTAQFMLGYFRFLINEWNAGRKLTNPYWIAGVDRINPNAVTYTKPILLLINELDFSGGDFFPAILQDNKRVTILGTRTAGAGGYVNSVDFPNDLGIDHISITQSLAHRLNTNPIENLGVTPDIEYRMTEEDYTSNYAPYKRKILETIYGMIK